MKTIFVVLLVLVVALSGCTQQGADANQVAGNDRDEHGCIPSAGYSWCEAKQKCLRPWEEPCETTAIQTKAREYCGLDNVASVSVCGEYVKVVSTDYGNMAFYKFDPSTSSFPQVFACGPNAKSEICIQLKSGPNCIEQKVC